MAATRRAYCTPAQPKRVGRGPIEEIKLAITRFTIYAIVSYASNLLTLSSFLPSFLPFSPPPFEPKITFQSPTRVRRLPISRMALSKEENGEKKPQTRSWKKKKRETLCSQIPKRIKRRKGCLLFSHDLTTELCLHDMVLICRRDQGGARNLSGHLEAHNDTSHQKRPSGPTRTKTKNESDQAETAPNIKAKSGFFNFQI